MKKTIYYLTGMRGRLASGLGQAMLSRGFEVTGRELIGEFKDLGFQDQIETVAEDLRSHFWSEDALVIANSFGAYLFLHAQTLMTPYVGRVLLLSPIVGEFANEDTMMNFIPPRSELLSQMMKQGTFPVPKQCEMHVGANDWQSNPRSVLAIAELTGMKATVVPDAGHSLPKAYIAEQLDRLM